MQLPIQIFEYREQEEQVRIRSINKDGLIWFYGADVCGILGIGNPSDVYRRIDKDDLDKIEGVDSLGRRALNTIISEYGLYDIVLRSNKLEARKFKRWITHEVIPQIRHTGRYGYTPNFVRRFNANWDRVDRGHFSIISELFIRVYGKLEQVGHLIPDKGPDGKEIRPDVSVGKIFPRWLEKHYPGLAGEYRMYDHLLPEGFTILAREYKNDVWPMFVEFVENEWLPNHAQRYFEKRDAKALEYLPLILPTRKKKELIGSKV